MNRAPERPVGLILDGVDLSRAAEFLFLEQDELDRRLQFSVMSYWDSLVQVLDVVADPRCALLVGKQELDASRRPAPATEPLAKLKRAMTYPADNPPCHELSSLTRISPESEVTARSQLSHDWESLQERLLDRSRCTLLAEHLRRELLRFRGGDIRLEAATEPLTLRDDLKGALVDLVRPSWGDDPNQKVSGQYNLGDFLERNVTRHFTTGVAHQSHHDKDYVPCISRRALVGLETEQNPELWQGATDVVTVGRGVAVLELARSAGSRGDLLRTALEVRSAQASLDQIKQKIGWDTFATLDSAAGWSDLLGTSSDRIQESAATELLPQAVKELGTQLSAATLFAHDLITVLRTYRKYRLVRKVLDEIPRDVDPTAVLSRLASLKPAEISENGELRP